MTTDVLDRTDEDATTSDTDDGELFSHYYRKADLALTLATGQPITALCGYKHTPTLDGTKYPTCHVCIEIHKGIPE
jgi:hypothetical protein